MPKTSWLASWLVATGNEGICCGEPMGVRCWTGDMKAALALVLVRTSGRGDESNWISSATLFLAVEPSELRRAFGMTEPAMLPRAGVASLSMSASGVAALGLGVFIIAPSETLREAPPKCGSAGFSGAASLAEASAWSRSWAWRSNAISLANCASPASMSFRSSLKSRRISRKQCRNCLRKGECLASIRFFSWMSTGTMFSHMFRFRMLLSTPRAASALALSPPPSTSPSSSWPARWVVKQMRISLQHKSAKPSLRAWPAGSAMVCGKSIFSSASTKAARSVVTIWAQTLNFWSLDIRVSMKR
mmetsp:Transcript_72464/g.199837  ORF Transcript_72464/g.199837 Transcript_72464/m.199837 type:complete len:303 (+) Transcript_72464:447-1355(+)